MVFTYVPQAIVKGRALGDATQTVDFLGAQLGNLRRERTLASRGHITNP